MNIKKLLNELTIKEKAALLSGINNWETTPIARLGIPSVKMADGPTGLRKELPGGKFLAPSQPATCFPLPVNQASTWNPDLIKTMGNALALEARDQGVDIVLGPGVNIKRSPLGGRNFEYFSEDPVVASKIATAFINGVQEQGVGTSLKHFALNNQEFRRMTISSEVGIRAMREIYLLPFEKAVKDAKPTTVMASYNLINGVQASENRWLLSDLLRKQWGYQGLVVSDWGAVVSRVEGVRAGLDLEMPSSNGLNDLAIVTAIENEQLSIEELDRAVTNVLQVIEGCLSNRRKYKKQAYDYEQGHAIAKQVALESAVLLKNEGILPISNHQSIAVIGELAHFPRYQGSGSSQVNPRKLVSFTAALDAANIKYEYAPGYGKYGPRKIKEALLVAKDKDVIILFMGLTEEYESEGFDRTHLNLPSDQLRLLKVLKKVHQNIVVVLSLGAPVIMPFINDVKAILNMYLAGEVCGEATYELLFGLANPSGKLAETFPKKLEDHASAPYFPMGPKHVAYKEGIYVGYRHFDKSRLDVLFPFGHGMSYSNFRYRNLIIENNLLDKNEMKITVEITNISEHRGAEVVQLYVGEMRPIIDRASSGLKEFQKVWLEPHETKVVMMTLTYDAFRFYHEKIDDWAVTGGDFKLYIGSSSRDIRISDVVYVIPKTMTITNKQVKITKITEQRLPEINTRYTRKTIDGAATFYDARSVSLVGFILYQAIKLGATSMVPKSNSKTVKKMVRQSAIMMPIRQLASFSNGKLSLEGVNAIILLIQGHLFKGLKALRADLKKQKQLLNKTDLYPINNPS